MRALHITLSYLLFLSTKGGDHLILPQWVFQAQLGPGEYLYKPAGPLEGAIQEA